MWSERILGNGGSGIESDHEVGSGKFSTELQRHGIISLGGINFVHERSKVNVAIVHRYSSCPLVALRHPINTAEARLTPSSLHIAPVLLMRADPKIASPVVQAVSVNMVYLLALGRSSDKPV